MRQTLTILVITTILSCNNQVKKMENLKLNYSNWQESFLKTVTNENNLLDYEKENLIETSKKITFNNFIDLRKALLKSNEEQKINTEYYLLQLSEGEVVSANFYYVIESNMKYQLSFVNIYEDNKRAVKLNKSDSDIRKLISTKPINNQTLKDKLVIITKINDIKVSTLIVNNDNNGW
jgi:hypothetical protein